MSQYLKKVLESKVASTKRYRDLTTELRRKDPGGGRNFKKGDKLIRQKKCLRYQFINDHQAQYPLLVMCEILYVSRSGYYKWPRRRAQK